MSRSVAVSVLLPAPSAAKSLRQTMQWLDAQTLGYADYQVVFILGDADEDALQRVAEVARHRPNVTVAQSDKPSAAEPDWSAGLRQAHGEYAVLLGARDRLHPWALAGLLDTARAGAGAVGGSDVVLGRSSGDVPVGFVPESLYDWKQAGDDVLVALLAPCALIRTNLLTAAVDQEPGNWWAGRIRVALAADEVDATDAAVAVGPGPAVDQSIEDVWRDLARAAELLADNDLAHAIPRFVAAHAAATARRHPSDLDPATAATAVELVRRYAGGVDLSDLTPCQRGVVAALRTTTAADPYADAVAAIKSWLELGLNTATESVGWVDGALAVDLSVAVSSKAGELPDGADAVGPQLILRNAGTTELHPVPSEVAAVPAEDRAQRRFRVTATIDPADAASGEALRPGSWQLLVRLRGSGAEVPKSSVVGFAPAQGAAVDGVLMRPYSHEGQLRLEVEGGTQGVFGRYSPDQASIVETADGALLTLKLPDIATRGTAVRGGRLHLGGFALPATLHVDGDGARLECYLSGLAGVSPLSVQIPPGPKQPLGLQLRIGASGDMAIEATPMKTPVKQAAPAAEPAGKPAVDQTPNATGTAATKPQTKQPGKKTTNRPTKKTTTQQPAKKTAKQPAKKTAGRTPRKAEPVPPAVQAVRAAARTVLPKRVRAKARRVLRQFL